MVDFEIIDFSFFGLSLQEPMAIVTNWLISGFSFYAYFKLRNQKDAFQKSFSIFYLILGISMIFGGLGHAFYQYTGIVGKYPAWILGIVAGFFAGKAILKIWGERRGHFALTVFLLVKSFTLIILSVLYQSFIFVAVDSVLTYIIYLGLLPLSLWKQINQMKYFVFGVLVLTPSIFIFLLNFNLHKYFNRDDLSHILMLSCIILFYFGAKKINFTIARLQD
jgi:hypothetical protein